MHTAFLEHLRKVHFSLLATCLAIFFVHTMESSPDDAALQRQVAALSELVSRMQSPSSYLRSATQEKPAPDRMQDSCMRMLAKSRRIGKATVQSHTEPTSEIKTTAPPVHDSHIQGITEGASIHEILKYWKSLPSESVYSTLSQLPVGADALLKNLALKFDGRSFIAHCRPETLATDSEAFKITALISFFETREGKAIWENLSFDLVFEKTSQSIPVRETLCKDLSSYCGDTLEAVFPRLRKYFLDDPTATLNDLEQLVNDQISQSISVDLFGLRIARGRLAVWGTILIASVQLYFLIHFFAWRRTDDDRFVSFPWIGVYAHPAAQFISIVSSCFIPVAVSIALASNWRLSPSLFITILSILLGIATFASLVRQK